MVDERYWTILVLAPIRRSDHVALPHFASRSFVKGMVASTLFLTMLSGIYQAMNCASRAWVEIGNHLESLLDQGIAEDLQVDDPDFSQSRKCFWVINSIDNFEQVIITAIEQWDWYCSANKLDRVDESSDTKMLEWVAKIRAEQRRLRDSEKRFKALRERARSLRDGVSSSLTLFAKTHVI
jgi:hypothetical protein